MELTIHLWCVEWRLSVVAEVVIVEEIDLCCTMGIFVTCTTIVLDDVRVSASSIWGIVNLSRLLRKFGVGPLHGTCFSGCIEMITALNAFSRGIRYEAAIIHDNIGVSACSIPLISREFHMVCSTQSENC